MVPQAPIIKGWPVVAPMKASTWHSTAMVKKHMTKPQRISEIGLFCASSAVSEGRAIRLYPSKARDSLPVPGYPTRPPPPAFFVLTPWTDGRSVVASLTSLSSSEAVDETRVVMVVAQVTMVAAGRRGEAWVFRTLSARGLSTRGLCVLVPVTLSEDDDVCPAGRWATHLRRVEEGLAHRMRTPAPGEVSDTHDADDIARVLYAPRGKGGGLEERESSAKTVYLSLCPLRPLALSVCRCRCVKKTFLPNRFEDCFPLLDVFR